MFEFDKASKWLITRHGDSLLRLGGIVGDFAWLPVQAEVVQPRQLPDGLLELRPKGGGDPQHVVIEIATYPERRVVDQIVRDCLLVYLDKGRMPEGVVLVLRPKGDFAVPTQFETAGPFGGSKLQVQWRVVELWKLKAEDILACADVGLVPWVPLMEFAGPPEAVIGRCRSRIEAEARDDEIPNLLAVTQVFTSLRFRGQAELLTLLGGREAMIQSPVIEELVQETTLEAALDAARKHALKIIGSRFGASAVAAVRADVDAFADARNAESLVDAALACRDIGEFRARLAATAAPNAD